MPLIGDAEPDRHDIEKRRVGKGNTLTAEIIGDGKVELIGSGAKALPLEQSMVDAPVGIGSGVHEDGAIREACQCQRHPRCRATMGRIENMCCQFHRTYHASFTGNSKEGITISAI